MTVPVEFAHTLEIDAPADAVWDYTTDWARNGEWIPMTRVEMDPGPTSGVGTRFRAWSGLGPIGFWDPMTVTAWEPSADGGGRCVVAHTGRVVKGDAVVTVTPLGPDRSRLEWGEVFTMSRVGAAAYKAAHPVLGAALKTALKNLARRVEAGV